MALVAKMRLTMKPGEEKGACAAGGALKPPVLHAPGGEQGTGGEPPAGQ